MADEVSRRWYRSGWFIGWAAAAILFGLMALIWALTSLPDPEYLAPGDDATDVTRRYVMLWVFMTLAVGLFGVGVAGSLFRGRRSAAPSDGMKA